MHAFTELTRYPGNKPLFDSVEMAITAIAAGVPVHLHAVGLRGLGKTTILRAAARVLPPITRIKGCPYNCDPATPHCPIHRGLSDDQIAEVGTEEVAMPFLEISHSAKIGTVVGSIDLAKLTNPADPEAALLPGLIPRAHRGIIFIDEINRLADTAPEITDVLLDVMGTKPGRVQIEETGLSPVSLPLIVSVWAASNPDEEPGPLEDIRKQLADRFDYVVEMGRPDSPDAVREILRQQRTSPAVAEQAGLRQKRVEHLRGRLRAAAERLPEVLIADEVDRVLAEIYVIFNIESLRAIAALQQAARLRAALATRNRAEVSDLIPVVPWVLGHRVDPDVLSQILAFLQNPSGFRASRHKSLSEPVTERPLPRPARRIRDLSADKAIATERDL